MGDSYRDLIVWQRAMQLCVATYKLTSDFPDTERFGLINQLRRCSVSIPSNIAEGYGKSGTGEYKGGFKYEAQRSDLIVTVA